MHCRRNDRRRGDPHRRRRILAVAFFSAKVKDATGTRRILLREADTSAEVAAQLRTEGLLVISVEEAKGPGSLPGRWNPSWLLPMSSFDVEMGLRQLASMLKSGVSLLEALRTTEEQSRCPRAMRAWRGVRDRVLSGDSFADALDADRRRFGEMAVRMARVGEQSGELDLALTRAADHLERRRNLRTMVINALVYPVIAVLMAVGVSVFLVVSVIPKGTALSAEASRRRTAEKPPPLESRILPGTRLRPPPSAPLSRDTLARL